MSHRFFSIRPAVGAMWADLRYQAGTPGSDGKFVSPSSVGIAVGRLAIGRLARGVMRDSETPGLRPEDLSARGSALRIGYRRWSSFLPKT
ncbi:hypothetical protein [Nocardia sp. R7R-8]|uniref:hypothetical protein n=1 Tax=Nocardia sp. R7R-8 TaxID=3459304 RepID=UPI00403E176D